MNNLLSEIYQVIIYQKEEAQMAEKRLEVEIEKLLHPYKEVWGEEDIGTIRELMYAIQMKAVEEGFKQGVKFAVDLLRGKE